MIKTTAYRKKMVTYSNGNTTQRYYVIALLKISFKERNYCETCRDVHYLLRKISFIWGGGKLILTTFQ